jgi:hypothetical protein
MMGNEIVKIPSITQVIKGISDRQKDLVNE